jgi:hypothetical protein
VTTGGGEDTAEALREALDAEADDEQQDLHGQADSVPPERS